MKPKLFGQITRPVMAVVGAWDPFLPAHQTLFAELAHSAHGTGLGTLGILIDPHPGKLIAGAGEWPIYDDIKIHIPQMLAQGLDGILLLRFFKSDLNATAQDFFDRVRPQVDLQELWLGATQNLGSGVGGGPQAIAELCAQTGVRLRRLPEMGLKNVGRDVRRLLRQGQLAEAIRIVDRPPLCRRPRTGRVQRAWAPGCYHAVPLRHPTAPLTVAPIEIQLQPTAQGGSSFAWPDRAMPYLAFLTGPADRPATADTAASIRHAPAPAIARP